MTDEMADRTMTKQGPLTVALIVDSAYASKYVHDLAAWARTRDDVKITHLIVQQAPAGAPSALVRMRESLRARGPAYVIRQVSFALITRLEAFALRLLGPHGDHLQQRDLQPYAADILYVTPTISPSGAVYRYTDGDLEKIKAAGLDVLIRCGSGILRGGILQAARFGIISFHHADNRINRGGPAGFWEVYERHDSTGFTIQQLTEELDGGNVLFRGAVPTRLFYLANQAAVYEKSNYYLKKILSELARLRQLPPFLPATPYFNRLYTRPTLPQQFRYVFSICAMLASKIFDRFVLRRQYRWGVAFARSGWTSLAMWRAGVIQNPPHHFLADPFVVRRDNSSICFVEDYDYRTSKGKITAYRLDGDNATLLGTALEEPFHLSFPFVFECDSQIYMCPESADNRDIRLYECVEFPLKWSLKTILMSDVTAADTMIFQKDGLWWMLTNIDTSARDDCSSELFVFYASHPLSGAWQSHPGNPVIVDSTRARNGGLLRDGDAIYRVGQRYAFDMYGKGYSINKITALDRSNYAEEPVLAVSPDFFENLRGTHHIHSDGQFTVFDFAMRSRRS